MAKTYEQKKFSELFYDFYKYMNIPDRTMFKLSIVTENNVKAVARYMDITKLEEKDITTLEGIIFNKLNPDTYSKEVPDDEEDYCWNIANEMLHRCELEIKSRHQGENENKPFVRTNTN